MRMPVRSAGIVVMATIITVGSSLAVAVTAAAEPSTPGPTMAPTPAPGDACALLTKEDAAAALGEAVSGPFALGNREAGPGATVASCEYTGSGIHLVRLNLTRLAPSAAPMYRAICAEKGKEGLAGLGDLACWYHEKHGELHVIKGTAFISIELRKSGDPTEAIKGVMRKALEHLPR